MSSPRSPAVKTPLEDDDLLSEILLRLPPQPSSLPRASLVCKRWHGLASDRGFFSRFRIRHRRKPPILGFFEAHSDRFLPTLEAPNRVPTGRFSLQRGDRVWFLGCRHGLVLFFDLPQLHLLVWDPVTGDQHRVAVPPGIVTRPDKRVFNGTVFRGAGEDPHFQLVLTTADDDDKQHRRALACVYSSRTGLWGDVISTQIPSEVSSGDNPIVDIANFPSLVYTGKPDVLAGNSIYWMINGNFVGILEFDLEKQSLAVIRVPEHMLELGQFLIVRAEGGGLGLLFLRGNILQLWKRKIGCDGSASWALGRTIKLNKLLSLDSQSKSILGFAEENNVMFLWACRVVFMVHLESLQFKKLLETFSPDWYHPFESVYTAETGIGGGHGAADLLHHA